MNGPKTKLTEEQIVSLGATRKANEAAAAPARDCRGRDLVGWHRTDRVLSPAAPTWSRWPR